jgi:hypothetical protein
LLKINIVQFIFKLKSFLPLGLPMLTCLLLIAGPNRLFGEQRVTRIDPPSPESLKNRTDWFGSYFQGNKCGWARVTRAKVTNNNKEYFVFELESMQKIASMGQAYDDHIFMHQHFMAEPPYFLVNGECRIKQGDSAIRIQLKKDGDEVTAVIDDGVEKREIIIPDLDFSFLDHLTVEDWIQSDPAVGERLNVRHFSFQDLKNSIETYQIIFSGEKEIQGKHQKVLEASWESSIHGDIGQITFNPEGRALLIRQGEMFEMRLEDEERAKKAESRADFFVEGTVAIDQKLGALPDVIASLVLDVTGEVASDFASGPGMSVEWDDQSKKCRLTTGYHQTPMVKATPEDIKDNIEETLKYPIHDKEVQALARQAIGNAKDEEDKVWEIMAFIDRFLGKNASPQIMTVKETIREKKGDCSERAALLVTLSRANGIPTREVHGLMYTSDLFKSFAGHSWCEVVLDGIWIPVDPTWRQIPIDGTHIRFESGDKGRTLLVKMMGGLTFHLVEVELVEPSGADDPVHDKAKKPQRP